jgi:hypothetical protein
METIKKYIYEWILTFSQKSSLFSSKKIERFAFVSVAISLVIGSFIYLVVRNTLTSSDTIILISPLLVAAGYGMKKTEEEKLANKPSDGEN